MIPTLHHAPLAVGLCLLDGHFERIFKRQPRLDQAFLSKKV